MRAIPSGSQLRRFDEQETGRIIALASELQERERSAGATGIDPDQLAALARELGIDPKFVDAALERIRTDDRGLLIDGALREVRHSLVQHFSGVCLTPAMEGTIAPRILLEEPSSVVVDWAGRTLRMELHDAPSGRTLVRWEASVAPDARSLRATRIASATMAVAAASVLAAGIPVLAAIFALVAATIYGVVQYDVSSSERDFIEFARTHLQNIQLLASSRGDEKAG